MTGKSLGLRSGSTGSLPLQQSNGSLYNHASPGIPRKPSKSFLSNFREKERCPSKPLLSNYREKERCFTCLIRWLCRRKVGMAMMFSLAVLVFVSSLCTVNKGAPGSSSLDFFEGLMGEKTSHEEAFPGHLLSQLQRKGNGGTGNNTAILNSLVSSVNKTHTAHTKSDKRVFKGYRPHDHPCRNFGLPPPPPTKGRRLGPRPCPVCYLPAEQAKDSMPSSTSISPVLDHLTFVHNENPMASEWHGGSSFGGYPSLHQRSDSYDIKDSMEVHCGFVKGSRPGRGSGFDIDEDDLPELEKFHDVIVASAIFGNYDIIQQPSNVSDDAKKNVPFYMFIDEETEKYMRNSSLLNSSRRIGIWKTIVVRNIPYTDARRNGKIPKLLLHRLFPNVRYSIWIDGKLKLVADPYQILERFLWRQNATFAISRHYTRFDVFVEAEANKAAGKYDNASIDFQVDFYRKEGLTPYSEAKLPITSDVPEGCVIIKEHIPITNLFTCLWFNEVDRFTARDQLSFSTVRDKIMSRVDWTVNMFLDCERRNFVVQTYHRELLEHMPPPPPVLHSHPVPLLPSSSIVRTKSVEPVKINGRKNPFRRRAGSRRRRRAGAGRSKGTSGL